MKFIFCPTALLVVVLSLLGAFHLKAAETPDAARVREIAAWLPESPAGFGWPIFDRAHWDKLAAEPALKGVIQSVNKLLAKPLAEVPDSLYLEYSRNGNRTHWQDAENDRRGRIGRFTVAEALENKGRFLPAIEKTIAVLCAEKTWVLPAHDGALKNFNGEEIEPDLGATTVAAELAELDFILGEKLSPATRRLIHDNVRRRVIEPFRAMVEGRQKEAWWLYATMNWNAVCVGNTIFAALTLEPSRADRAWFAAAGEYFIRYSLLGFTTDGYCAEGIGYWNYGYGHDILLFETLRRATGGRLDMFDSQAAIQPALFCLRAEIFPEIYPTISDCAPGTQASAALKGFVCRRLGLAGDDSLIPTTFSDLHMDMMFASLEENVPHVQQMVTVNASPLRSYFPFGGVLITRTAADAQPPVAAVLKGGNNDEPHNHNDVASFSFIVGTNMLVCDPGGEVYTKRTFGPHRYDSGVLNSFGHAVPVVAGELQRTGRDAHGVILETNFTDAADTWRLDYHSAYAVKTLQQLERTFVFARGAAPSLTVTDAVKFSRPEKFESALVTWGTVKQLDEHTLEITDGGSTVRVAVDTQGRSYHLKVVKIDEDVHSERKPYHVGIVLNSKISAATITLRIFPVTK